MRIASLLVLSLVTACTREESNVQAEGDRAQPEAKAQATASDTIGVHCRAGSEIEADLAGVIEARARGLYKELEAGEFDKIWAALHPQARDDGQKDKFLQALQSMQPRLQESAGDPKLELLYHVDVSGGVNDMARVFCGGGPDDPDALVMMTNVGAEDLGLVTLLSDGGPFGYATTVQLRQRGNDWHLVGVQVNPATFRGKTAEQYEAQAKTSMSAAKPVESYLTLGLAQTLASRGTSVSPPTKRRIERTLEQLKNDQLFKAHVGPWKVGDTSYEVLGFSLASTRGDMSVVVKYVTPGGLVRESLDREADALLGYVRATYPDVATTFDAVVFEAYAHKPTEKDKAYDAYRVARYFDPAKRPIEG